MKGRMRVIVIIGMIALAGLVAAGCDISSLSEEDLAALSALSDAELAANGMTAAEIAEIRARTQVPVPPAPPAVEKTLCCATARGGGSITITDQGDKKGPRKATFGFQLVCEKTDDPMAPRVKGQFEYQDHVKKVSIHAAPDSVLEIDKTLCTGKHAEFSGEYRPQPARPDLENGGKGAFTIKVDDNGKRGPSDGDKFFLELKGGVYDKYVVEGTLTGGNIKAF